MPTCSSFMAEPYLAMLGEATDGERPSARWVGGRPPRRSARRLLRQLDAPNRLRRIEGRLHVVHREPLRGVAPDRVALRDGRAAHGDVSKEREEPVQRLLLLQGPRDG